MFSTEYKSKLVLAPLTNNPNTPNRYENTPIHSAAYNGHMEIVKILAPLTDNPNTPNKWGETPIYMAAYNGMGVHVQKLSKS